MGDEGGILFLCSVHSLWHARNTLVFNQIIEKPEDLIQKAEQAVTEASTLHLSKSLASDTPPGSNNTNNCRSPEAGRYKVNVDAKMINDGRRGVSVVIRDEECSIMMAITLEASSILSIIEAEAEALFIGLLTKAGFGKAFRRDACAF
ncbi:hypothetical protein PIB30_003674 [Stylosanthes scabra]|uniref:RNase H type-1 domain-containing protein n=1 Tax=Stylosanthes scabra TaxID=79078 RepID=A0ABU6Z367_9FABA|nr:hypothetical protein [Stylosanthes scabra]